MNERSSFEQTARATAFPPSPLSDPLRCGDLYCGDGNSGFGLAARNLGLDVVYAFEPDDAARTAYAANFGLVPQAGIVGDRLTHADVPPLNLLFSRLPYTTEEFDGVALRFLRLRHPVGVVFGGSGDDKDVEQVVEHIQRRMGQEGYVVSYRSLESRPFQYLGGVRHLLVAGTFRKEAFPWSEVESLAEQYDSATTPGDTPPLLTGLSPERVSLPVAKAVIGVMAEFVRETAGRTSNQRGAGDSRIAKK